jgi:hypothetical protein
MTKPTSNTSEQLRKLMQSHVEKAAAKPEPALKTSEIISTPPVTVTETTKSAALVQIPSTMRYSLKLRSDELSKIGSIIHNTFEKTGERVTLTDVLRVGVGRVGESSPLTRQEIVYLRATDRRRTKAQG